MSYDHTFIQDITTKFQVWDSHSHHGIRTKVVRTRGVAKPSKQGKKATNAKQQHVTDDTERTQLMIRSLEPEVDSDISMSEFQRDSSYIDELEDESTDF